MCEQDLTFEVAVGSDFPKQIIPLINDAKTTIKIIVFDWRWYPNDLGSTCQLFNRSIINASKRGVHIMALTNIGEVINVLKLNGIQAKKPLSKRLLHSKLMIIDNKIIVIGSHNYTQSAFTMNQEISIILKAKNGFDRFVSYFDKVWLS